MVVLWVVALQVGGIMNNNLIMERSGHEMQLYIRYSKKARNQQHYHDILQRVEPAIDFRPFGIEKVVGERALALYSNLREKYRKGEISVNQDGWYETEKKVFVWFVVMHTYYLQKEGIKLGSISEFREAFDLKALSKLFFGKSAVFIQFQLLALIKITEKIQWGEEEDRLITEAVGKCGAGRWVEVSREIFQASNGVRFINAKSCRERWQNHLDDTKIKGNWTAEEDLTIVEAVLVRYGKKWSKMKGELHYRRTEHMIKNRYNSLMTRYKRSRHQKQRQVSDRMLRELREKVQANRALNQESNHQRMQFQYYIQSEKYILKQQNLSPQQQQIPAFQLHQRKQSQEKAIQQGQLQKQKVQKQSMVKFQAKLSPQHSQQDQIYPFQNYSYQLQMCNYQQMHQIQINHLLYYPQYMNFPLPTAETYQNTKEVHPNLKEEQKEGSDNIEEA